MPTSYMNITSFGDTCTNTPSQPGQPIVILNMTLTATPYPQENHTSMSKSDNKK